MHPRLGAVCCAGVLEPVPAPPCTGCQSVPTYTPLILGILLQLSRSGDSYRGDSSKWSQNIFANFTWLVNSCIKHVPIFWNGNRSSEISGNTRFLNEPTSSVWSVFYKMSSNNSDVLQLNHSCVTIVKDGRKHSLENPAYDLKKKNLYIWIQTWFTSIMSICHIIAKILTALCIKEYTYILLYALIPNWKSLWVATKMYEYYRICPIFVVFSVSPFSASQIQYYPVTARSDSTAFPLSV